ncbi:MAG TPA: two-component regulator propeller domain-containing protein [Anaerolineaceae bacterium]|nr:two-component regulator propeller domain-containing protein [Anaerolineaceae bacterium]
MVRIRRYRFAIFLRLAVILGCLFAAGGFAPEGRVLAAESSALPQQSISNEALKFSHLTVQQGLPASQIYCLLQDSAGYLWFGTEDGLARYDGYDFVVFRSDPNNPNSLSDSTILSLYEDRQGRLWVGTQQGGLNLYERSTGRFIRYISTPMSAFSLSDNTVSAIQEDSQGRLWVGTKNGLNRLNELSFTFDRYLKDAVSSGGISNERVNALAADPRGGLWVGTADGLDYFDLESEEFTHYRYDRDNLSSLGNNQITSLWLDPVGILWVGTSRGLDRFDPSIRRFAHYRYNSTNSNSLGDNSVLSITGDRDGTLWVGTQQGGVNRFFSATGRFVRSSNHPDDPYSISSNMVFAILEDRSGLIWLGTDKGASKYDPVTLRFPHYRHIPNDPDSLAGDNVLSIFQDRNRTVWVGTDKGLDRLDPIAGKFIHYQHNEYDPTSLAQDVVTSILEDSHGNLWIGTSASGLDRLDVLTGQFTHFREEPGSIFGPSTDEILTLYEDREGNLWIGTNGAGLKRLDPLTGQYTHYGLVEEDGNIVNSIFQDSRGVIWIGTYAGLGRYDSGSNQLELVSFEGNNPLRLNNYKVFVIQEGQQGLLWLGTLGGGLLSFDPLSEQVVTYLKQEDLANNVIYGILEAEDGLLWLSTNKGLTRFDPLSGATKNYDVEDGVQSEEFNPGAFFRGADGELYFGGVYGFNVFNPLQIEENAYIPPIVLTSMTQNGVPVRIEGEVDTVEEVILRWPNNYFEFEYAALNFRQPDENQYSYRLENFDEQWNDVGLRRYGQYTNLPGGSYSLIIRGSNNDGLWNETGIKLKITVVPPWWEMDWFRWGVPLAVLLILFGGYYLRLHGIQRRNRQLAKEVEERTREIEQRRQVAEGLREVLVRLNSSQALGETLAFIMTQANRLTGSYRAILFELNADGLPRLMAYAENVVLDGETPLAKRPLKVAGEKGSNQIHEITTIQAAPLLNWMVDMLKPDSPVVLRDLSALPRLRKPPRHVLLQNVHTLVLTPVLAGERLYGGLAVMYPPRRLSPEDIPVLTSLADHTALAVENENLRLKAEQLAVVSERARLARDLHDAVTQTLFSASLIAEALPTLWHQNEEDSLQLLQELRQLNRGALAEMRSLLMELRPSAVIEMRLSDLLYQLAESVTGRTGAQVCLDLHEGVRLPEDVHICLYRIAQETLTNVVKHAQASEISLSLNYSLTESPGDDAGGAPLGALRGERISEGITPDITDEIVRVCLEICDNGHGFDIASVPPDHFGLRNIRERAAAIGADLEVSSQPGQGTRVRVVWNGEVGNDE